MKLFPGSCMIVTTLLATLSFAGNASAGTPLTTVRVASGLTEPLFVGSPPSDFERLFIVEQTGRIKIMMIDTGSILGTPYIDLSGVLTSTGNEQGLLGLAFDPNWNTTPFIYVNYSRAADGATIVARYQATSADPASNTANPATATTLLTVPQPFSNHNGGWLGFSPNDGYLYVAMGDGGSANDPSGNGQNINVALGKMLRLTTTGAAAPGNPFFGAIPGLDTIWAYGLRNPWRNSFDALTGDLYIGDVGQGAWEEINFQSGASAGGQNYGWRCMEGNHCTGLTGCTCNAVTLTDPIQEYSHASGISVTGGYVYRGCAVPDLDGTYFYADYGSASIWSIDYTGTPFPPVTNRTAELDPPTFSIGTISSFGVDAYGEIYICDHSGGEVFKIISAVDPLNDCNENGVEDACDILDGSSPDADMDEVPDECVAACSGLAQCADTNSNSRRDDTCIWWSCQPEGCEALNVLYADMGGVDGACVPDGSTDANDKFHVLNCFSDTNLGVPGGYPCEPDGPVMVYNVDAGGAGLSCCPDGACDSNDVFAALNAFSGGSLCTVCPQNTAVCIGGVEDGLPCGSDSACPGGLCVIQNPGSHPCAPPNAVQPLPGLSIAAVTIIGTHDNHDTSVHDTTRPAIQKNAEWNAHAAGKASLNVVASRPVVAAGELVSVDVYLRDLTTRLRGYQLHLEATGGRRGLLELVDIAVKHRPDRAFAGIPSWEAFNAANHQMLAGLDGDAVATPPAGYLATFTYRASPQAAGTFVVDVLGYLPAAPERRTFLFGEGTQPIVLNHVQPATIRVSPDSSVALR